MVRWCCVRYANDNRSCILPFYLGCLHLRRHQPARVRSQNFLFVGRVFRRRCFVAGAVCSRSTARTPGRVPVRRGSRLFVLDCAKKNRELFLGQPRGARLMQMQNSHRGRCVPPSIGSISLPPAVLRAPSVGFCDAMVRFFVGLGCSSTEKRSASSSPVPPFFLRFLACAFFLLCFRLLFLLLISSFRCASADATNPK